MTKPIQIKNLTIGAGIPKICVPLTGTTEEKICQEAKDAKKAGADLVEWRADFFEGLMDKEACKQVLGKLSEILGETPLLFTIRTSEEGGNIAISMEDYSACCRNAARSHIADLVDVEVMGNPEEKKKLVAELQREGVKIIASSHDFDKTDSQEILLDRFREMEKSGADDPADRYRRYLGFERDQPEVRERPKEDEPVRAGQPKARILFAWRKGLRHQ